MTKNNQDHEDKNSLGSIFVDPKFLAAHDEMMKEAEFTKNKRRDRLTLLYTNSCKYEELGFGLKELVDYVITLEDAVSPTRGDIRRMSWDV